MPRQGIETVGVDLEGNFKGEARESAAAAKGLADGLDKLGEASGRVKAPALVGEGDRLKALARDADAAARAVEKLAQERARAAREAESQAKAEQSFNLKLLQQDLDERARRREQLRAASRAAGG